MPVDGSKPSQFQWDEGDDELELRSKPRRRYDAWKIYAPGFAAIAAAVPLGAYVPGAQGPAAVGLALATAVQLFLTQTHALRRAEVEYLWPLERHVRLGDLTGATYRDRARHATVELDGAAVDAHDVRQVQVRTVVEPTGGEKSAEVFLVLDDRVILVERSADRTTLREYAEELRKRLGVDQEPAQARPITLAPTQGGGCREMWWPLIAGVVVGAVTDGLLERGDPLVALSSMAALVTVTWGLTFWIYRKRLRRASRRWVRREFGLDPRPVQGDGSYLEP